MGTLRWKLLWAVALVTLCSCKTPKWCQCPSRAPVVKAKTRKVTPVIFVHGLRAWGHKEFCNLKHFLRARGYPKDLLRYVDYKPSNGSLTMPEAARQVSSQVQIFLRQLKARGMPQKLDVVAMSMGTIVTRYWMQHLGGVRWVRTYIALSGPHYGTRAAELSRFFPGLKITRGIRQLRRKSAFLESLNRGMGKLKGLPVYAIFTPRDRTITPATSSCLPIAVNVQIDVSQHRCVPHSAAVMKVIYRILQRRGAVSFPKYAPDARNRKRCPNPSLRQKPRPRP